LTKLNEVVSGKFDKSEVKAFCDISGIVIETLKVEIAYLKSNLKNGIDFIPTTKLIDIQE
jgi:hypothetical protein